VHGLAAGVEERSELRIVTEATARQEGRDRPTEAREGWRIEERRWQVPLQARTDHAANGSRVTLTEGLSARYRLSGLTVRPEPAGRALRAASHSYHDTSSWLALKIEE
jgi:hypothetical protein